MSINLQIVSQSTPSPDIASLRERLRRVVDTAGEETLRRLAVAVDEVEIPIPPSIPSMSDPGLEEELAEAQRQYDRGEWVSWEDVRASLFK